VLLPGASGCRQTQITGTLAHMRAVIEALQALRNVAKLTAVTIVTEVGTFKRFRRPTEMMGYTGFVPSEYSSGGRESKGRLTAPATRTCATCLAKPLGTLDIGRG
jgi:transposase